MTVARAMASATAALALAGCALAAVGTSRPAGPDPSHRTAFRQTSHRTPIHRTSIHRTPTHRTSTHPAAKGHKLPLGFGTGHARKVITVVARSHSSTTATLQAWSRAAGGGWVKHGSAVHAHVGSDGLSRHASESKSATPVGSFTLTRAFGRDTNPGTSLPYVHTTPADWWISQAGPLYNTLQVCSRNCSFNQGNPNEHLYYETPYYDYAVVIDYNTRNAPGGVRPGRGSAFFLHVHPAGTGSTAGCVDIPARRLVGIMRWLTSQAHARILIGVG